MKIPESRPPRAICPLLAALLVALLLANLGASRSASAAELLTAIDLHQDGLGGVEGLAGVRSVAISADGKHVFTAASEDHSVSSWLRNEAFGTLGLLETFEDEAGGVFGLLGVAAVAVSPDGDFVLAAGSNDDSLAIWSRDADMNDLAFVAAELQENGVGGVEGLDGAIAVAISRDWQIFVASQVADAVAVFSRGTGTDHSFVEAEKDGVNGVEGLDGASAVAVSPDALHVYVTGRVDDTLVVFERTGGQLDFVARYTNGADGVVGLDGAIDVVVSPDNAHVYAVGEVSGEVAAFARDTSTGELTFSGGYSSEGNGVEGLDGITSIAIDSTGDRVLVTSRKDDAVLVFRRDPATGALEPLEKIRHGVNGVIGLRGASDIAISPDSTRVYVAAADGNTLTGWALASCIGDEMQGDSDGDAYCDDVDLCEGDDLAADSDGDSICDDLDACPGFPDSDDADGDLIPDGCDLCRVNDAAGDSDGDGLCDDIDPEFALSSTHHESARAAVSESRGSHV